MSHDWCEQFVKSPCAEVAWFVLIYIYQQLTDNQSLINATVYPLHNFYVLASGKLK